MLLNEDFLFLFLSLSEHTFDGASIPNDFLQKRVEWICRFSLLCYPCFSSPKKKDAQFREKKNKPLRTLLPYAFSYTMPCLQNQKSKKKNRLLISVIRLILSISHFLRNITRSPIQSSHITICSRLYSRCIRSITPLLSRKDLGRDDHGRTDGRSVETRVSDGFGAIHCGSVEARVCKVLVGVARSCSISCRHGAGGEWDCVVVAIRGLGWLVSRRR